LAAIAPKQPRNLDRSHRQHIEQGISLTLARTIDMVSVWFFFWEAERPGAK
jgi:hypothetical protein